MSDTFPKFRFTFSLSGILLIPIFLYKKLISPHMPPCCRFTPTCTVYTAQAILRFGPFKGLALGIWRVLRCNPFCKGGYDPVPPKKKVKRDTHRS